MKKRRLIRYYKSEYISVDGLDNHSETVHLSAYDVGKKRCIATFKKWTNKSLNKSDISKSCTIKKEVGVYEFN